METETATKEPPAKVPATTSKALATWEAFRDELMSREDEIASMLPRHITKEKFMSSAIAAVKQTPALLTATPRSLFSAITNSAQDGLLPDGREGVVTIYKEKQKNNTWLEVAQWNPMVFGLRKRAREIDGIIVNAQVVHKNDLFEWDEGDDPHIEHKPARLGTPRGEMIGAYAIFRSNVGGILHREVMDAEQINAVKSQSKSPGGTLWSKFATEAWRKTVVRRGFKSVPCSEHLQTIVQRDDDMFAFDGDPPAGRPVSEERPTRDQYVADGSPSVNKPSMAPHEQAGSAPPASPETDHGEPYALLDEYGEVVERYDNPHGWLDSASKYLGKDLSSAAGAAKTFQEHNQEMLDRISDALGSARDNPRMASFYTLLNGKRGD